jgi:hypothetical protein
MRYLRRSVTGLRAVVCEMLGVSYITAFEGWKVRSKEPLDEFWGRPLAELDVVALMVNLVFPSKASCVVV